MSGNPVDESPDVRWTGRVSDVEGDLFTAELERPDGPPLVADFRRSLLPDVRCGDVITVTPSAVERVDLGVWTAEELDRAKARARAMTGVLAECAD